MRSTRASAGAPAARRLRPLAVDNQSICPHISAYAQLSRIEDRRCPAALNSSLTNPHLRSAIAWRCAKRPATSRSSTINSWHRAGCAPPSSRSWSELRLAGPMSINALAKRLVMDRTTLGRNILPLERDGLIEIVPDPADGRSKVVRLTEAGAARLRAARSGWTQAQKKFEAAFGGPRAARLRDLLHAVTATELDRSQPPAAEPHRSSTRRGQTHGQARRQNRTCHRRQ